MKTYPRKLGFSWRTVSEQISEHILLWTQWIWTAVLCFQVSLRFTFSQLFWNNICYKNNASNTHRQKNSHPFKTIWPLHLYCFCNKCSPSHWIPSKRSSGNLKIQANRHATLKAFIFMSIKFHLLKDQSSSAATDLHIQPASCWGATGHEIHEYIRSKKRKVMSIVIQLNDHIFFTGSSTKSMSDKHTPHKGTQMRWDTEPPI